MTDHAFIFMRDEGESCVEAGERNVKMSRDQERDERKPKVKKLRSRWYSAGLGASEFKGVVEIKDER